MLIACHCMCCFFGVLTLKSELACYYLNAEISGTNMLIACHCMCCFFWVLTLKIKVGLLLLECRIFWN